MSLEYLLALGFDEETANGLLQTSGRTGNNVESFKKLSMNYSDILADSANIKKGDFVAGFIEDKKTLSIKETGVHFGNKIEFFVAGIAYQVSKFDTSTNSIAFCTPIFFSPFDTKKMRDKQTGMTVEEYKNSGKDATFNQIMLLMVKTGDSYEPYIHYMHGTNYNKWREQLEALEISDYVLKYNFEVKSEKVPTNYVPAWCFKIVKATERDVSEIASNVKVVSEAVKKFNKWITASNSNTTTQSEPKPAKQFDDFDITDDDINF
jgi:hypothetical protein